MVKHSRLIGVPILLFVGSLAACTKDPNSTVDVPSTPADTKVDIEAIRPQVVAFCGDCHATPLPESFPRDGWAHEVDRGYDFYYRSGRTDLGIPPKRQVVAFFRTQAREKLLIRNAKKPDGILSFKKTQLIVRPEKAPSPTDGPAAIAHLLWTGNRDPATSDPPHLFVCDMHLGGFAEVLPGRDKSKVKSWTKVSHPSHAEPTDLDQDGQWDVLVADLGSYLPADHDQGRVLWLRRSDQDQAWDVIELATGIGRVADVQPGDFDDDGDLDLVVAEFGYHETGRILLLINQGISDGEPNFELTVVDPRHGAIHVPVVDLNGDGRLDFVALISQEYETIEAFLNQGDGTFRAETVFRAADPSFGSSGIQLTDLDGDGDTDVLCSNGDMFDSFYLKPYHGVRWMENQGDGKWQDHILGQMPGVMRAIAGDLDGDGDLDVAASADVPPTVFGENSESTTLASLMWFEQIASKEFVPHVLETDQCHHSAIELADFDDDGDLDLAVGNFGEDVPASVTFWWNETDQPATENH